MVGRLPKEPMSKEIVWRKTRLMGSEEKGKGEGLLQQKIK